MSHNFVPTFTEGTAEYVYVNRSDGQKTDDSPSFSSTQDAHHGEQEETHVQYTRARLHSGTWSLVQESQEFGNGGSFRRRPLPRRNNSAGSKSSTNSSRTTTSGNSHQQRDLFRLNTRQSSPYGQPSHDRQQFSNEPSLNGRRGLPPGASPASFPASLDHSQIPTFSEQTHVNNMLPSTISSLRSHSNSVSTSTDEDMANFDNGGKVAPPSFSLTSFAESSRMHSTLKTVDSGKPQDRHRHTMYHLSLLCCSCLLFLMILLATLYFGGANLDEPFEVTTAGGAFSRRFMSWVGPIQLEFAANTFPVDTLVFVRVKPIADDSEELPASLEDLFKSSTYLHQAEDPYAQYIEVECDQPPAVAIELDLPLPQLELGRMADAELFGLFEVKNVYPAGVTAVNEYYQFEVLEREFSTDYVLRATLPVTVFRETTSEQQANKWTGAFLLALTPGRKLNQTTPDDEASCYPVLCPFQGITNPCETLQEEFLGITTTETPDDEVESVTDGDVVTTTESEEINLGVTYEVTGGTDVVSPQGTTAYYFLDPQTGLMGIVLQDGEDEFAKLLYLGLAPDERALTSEAVSVEQGELLGVMPGDSSETVPFTIQAFPSEEYLNQYNYLKQRVRPCYIRGNLVDNEFVIVVSDQGLLKDDLFEALWDQGEITPDSTDDKNLERTYKFSRLTPNPHTLTLKASKVDGILVKNDEATYRVELQNLFFSDDTPGVNDDRTVATGSFHILGEITFIVRLFD